MALLMSLTEFQSKQLGLFSLSYCPLQDWLIFGFELSLNKARSYIKSLIIVAEYKFLV